jgi:hypothetical protein
MVSSAAMSISSIIVVLISNMMRLFNLDPTMESNDTKVVDSSGEMEVAYIIIIFV